MRAIALVCVIGYSTIAVLFLGSGVVLVVFAAIELWNGVTPEAAGGITARFDSVLEAIAILTIAVAAMELGQTVLEEEVHREVNVSAPTRVRRFLSRFLIVVVVALSVETLVTAFRFSREDPSRLPEVAMIGFAAAALLIAWGVFVRLNSSAERLEPEAMERTKREDRKVERKSTTSEDPPRKS